MFVEILIDFQFIKNVATGIIVIIMSYYCYQLLTKGFPASFCTVDITTMCVDCKLFIVVFLMKFWCKLSEDCDNYETCRS